MLRYGLCVTRGSHSFTCHPHTNHICLYFPDARRHLPLAGTHSAYPQRDGQAECGGCGWLHTKINVPHWELNQDTVTYPSANLARRRLTSLTGLMRYDYARPPPTTTVICLCDQVVFDGDNFGVSRDKGIV